MLNAISDNLFYKSLSFMCNSFPFQKQKSRYDCGLACIAMISIYYENYNYLQYDITTKIRLSILDISNIVQKLEFQTLAIKVNFEDLKELVPLPCIIHWKNSHFVVVYKFKAKEVCIADPAIGLITITEENFIDSWISEGNKGYVLVIQPDV